MTPVLLQTGAVIFINLRSLSRRFWMSLSTVVAIALVVSVLLAFLAMSAGFRHTIRGAGSPEIALIMRPGSEAEINSALAKEQLRLIEEAPGIAFEGGKPLVSGELYLVVDGRKRQGHSKANLPLRGIGAEGLALRRGFHITQGRMFQPGLNEIVVGSGLLKEFEGFELGKQIRFGTGEWTIVGVFDAGGTVLESELWADAAVVQSYFHRENYYQTVRIRLQSEAALGQLRSYLENDPRLKLEVISEADYFAKQASRTSDLILYLGWPLALAMACGALAGALNTMYNSVAARALEIATLRAIGFGGIPVFLGTLAESMALAVIGGLIGSAAAYVLFDGLTASTLGGSFTQVVFNFRLTSTLVVQGFILALGVGLLGGVFPAFRAIRLPIASALQG
ncbi:MAG TPA: ABC transporter permease [Rhodospirillaceae bacterium]|nr:ABC transporter permease [Rhodospirillaceae bacterium]